MLALQEWIGNFGPNPFSNIKSVRLDFTLRILTLMIFILIIFHF